MRGYAGLCHPITMPVGEKVAFLGTTLLVLVMSSSGCSPLPGWIESTPDEQAYLAVQWMCGFS